MLLATLFFTNTSVANTVYVCSNQTTDVDTQHNQGRVVTKVHFDSRCTSRSLLEFRFPSQFSNTSICNPTDYSKIPRGWVAIEFQNGPSNCNPTGGNSRHGYIIRKPSESGLTNICSGNHHIPSGFIVTRTQVNDGSKCTSSITDNAMNTIKKATANREHRCAYSGFNEMPAGYVVTDQYNGSSCRLGPSSSQDYSQYIQIPSETGTTRVCQYTGSNIPPGFAIVSQGQYSQCSRSGSGFGYLIQRVSGNQADICGSTGDHVPEGYVVTRITDDSACTTHKRLTVKLPSATGTAACTIGGSVPVPAGYVIYKNNTASHPTCDGNRLYEIKVPSGDSQFICNGSDIPEGWAVTEEGTHPNCSGSLGSFYANISRLTGDGPYTICSTSNIPDGFVINKLVDSWTCSTTAWSVLRPNPTPGVKTVVCNQHTDDLPTGFAIVKRGSYPQCNAGSGSGPGFEITKPFTTGVTSVCQGTPLPSGYAFTRLNLSNPNCGSGNQGAEITILDGPGPYTVCSTEGVPDSYSVTRIVNTPYCSFDQGFEIVQPSTSGVTAICSGSNVPEGMIVTELFVKSDCTFNQGWKIRFPSQTGTTLKCNAGPPIPEGFEAVGSTFNTAQCGYTSSGPGVQIQIINHAITPTLFIRTEADVTGKPTDPSVSCSVGSVNPGLVGTAAKNPAGCN